MMTRTPLQLIADRGHLGALRCLIAASHFDIPIEIQRYSSNISSSVTLKRFDPRITSSDVVIGEDSSRPLILTKYGPIFTTLAICNYLKKCAGVENSRRKTPSNTLLQKVGVKESDSVDGGEHAVTKKEDVNDGMKYSDSEEYSTQLIQKGKLCNFHPGDAYLKLNLPGKTDAKWIEQEWLNWVTSHLDVTLNGLCYNRVLNTLNFLESFLTENKVDGTVSYFCEGQFSLVDIFIWSSLSRLRFQRNFQNWPNLFEYLKFLDSVLCVKKTVDSFPNFLTKTLSFPLSPFYPPSKHTTLLPSRKFYLTTAINYTNGPPHIGHAYEAITSDVISRFHRMYNEDVFFLTGTDEHGQKIANTAKARNMKPYDMCQEYYEGFVYLNKKLNISQDFFIRTTMDFHKETCQWLWKRALDNDDIYPGLYIGWYNEREEMFVSENDASLSDYKDPSSGLPLKRMEEKSYFFRMSRYQERLVQHIKDNPNFILPESKKIEILSRLSEPLNDLSCSRTSFTWGIGVPDDKEHVMYVWFDALTNYLSAVRSSNGELNHFWPADVHIIGKDIAWFHAVIWPCMLMSTNLPLPDTIFSHGFVSADDGRKMSKSLGNVIDPLQIISEFPVDTFRFFLSKETRYGSDLKFDYVSLLDTHNNELANNLGNLVHRITNLCHKYCDGRCPKIEEDVAISAPFDFVRLADEVYTALRNFDLQGLADLTMAACRDSNKYLTDSAPWAMDDTKEIREVISVLLNAMYYLAHFFHPFMPSIAEELFDRLGTPKSVIPKLSIWFNSLTPGTPVKIGKVLFQKITYGE